MRTWAGLTWTTSHHGLRNWAWASRACGGCVCGGMNILRTRCARQLTSVLLNVFQEFKALLDVRVVWIELGCAAIGVNGITDLVVATLIEGAEIEPNFGDVRINPDCPRVGVQGITVLIDLEIEHAD
jgi:hypothetical protein